MTKIKGLTIGDLLVKFDEIGFDALKVVPKAPKTFDFENEDTIFYSAWDKEMNDVVFKRDMECYFENIPVYWTKVNNRKVLVF